jgi:hypothetical protein
MTPNRSLPKALVSKEKDYRIKTRLQTQFVVRGFGIRTGYRRPAGAGFSDTCRQSGFCRLLPGCRATDAFVFGARCIPCRLIRLPPGGMMLRRWRDKADLSHR